VLLRAGTENQATEFLASTSSLVKYQPAGVFQSDVSRQGDLERSGRTRG